MVSKRTGLPRGRPRKPKAHRDVGRPALLLRDDPDRYAIALLDVMLGQRLGSERACAMAAATWRVGVQGDPARLLADGYLLTNWERYLTQAGASPATLEGCASALRGKRRRYASAPDRYWRAMMSAAFMAVIANPPKIKVALFAAEVIGEADFVRENLLPKIAARISG